jgi:hypothetical protein
MQRSRITGRPGTNTDPLFRTLAKSLAVLSIIVSQISKLCTVVAIYSGPSLVYVTNVDYG